MKRIKVRINTTLELILILLPHWEENKTRKRERKLEAIGVSLFYKTSTRRQPRSRQESRVCACQEGRAERRLLLRSIIPDLR